MSFVALGLHHAEALASFVDDFHSHGEHTIPALFLQEQWSHAEAVRQFASWPKGELVREGLVPTTTTFLEVDGQLVGVSNFRHRLTPRLSLKGGHVGYSVRPSARGKGYATRLLEHAKNTARSFDIPSMVLTTHDKNLASIRVIEKCGGVRRDTYWFEPDQVQQVRYDLPTS